MKVFALNFRLVPEALFPAAVEDAVATYMALTGISLKEGSNCMFEKNPTRTAPRNIYFMGDSSSAALTMQLLLALKSLNWEMPGGIVMLSPFIDHELKGESLIKNGHLDMLNVDYGGLDWLLRIYANGLPLSHPSITCFNADLTDFPPTLIQTGDCDIGESDAETVYHELRKVGTTVFLESFSGMIHSFQRNDWLFILKYSLLTTFNSQQSH